MNNYPKQDRVIKRKYKIRKANPGWFKKGRISPQKGIRQDFWAKVKKTDGCWIWANAKAKNSGGYGQVRLGEKRFSAHRVAYEITNGKIPAGLTLDHLCRNKACVNPAHLEPVTQRENVLRGISIPALNIRKTGCPKGHIYDYYYKFKTHYHRKCSICTAESQIKYYTKRAKKENLPFCLRCGAEKGNPCHNRKGKINPPHRIRFGASKMYNISFPNKS